MIYDKWRKQPTVGEKFDEPSMCEPCECLTIEKIYTDYCRGIVHQSRLTPYYDEGDEVVEVPRYDDFADVLPSQSPYQVLTGETDDSVREDEPQAPEAPASVSPQGKESPADEPEE